MKKYKLFWILCQCFFHGTAKQIAGENPALQPATLWDAFKIRKIQRETIPVTTPKRLALQESGEYSDTLQKKNAAGQKDNTYALIFQHHIHYGAEFQ